MKKMIIIQNEILITTNFLQISKKNHSTMEEKVLRNEVFLKNKSNTSFKMYLSKLKIKNKENSRSRYICCEQWQQHKEKSKLSYLKNWHEPNYLLEPWPTGKSADVHREWNISSYNHSPHIILDLCSKLK